MSSGKSSGKSETSRERIRVERGAKRVRAYLGGQVVADTLRPVLVWEVPHYPAYYIPVDDVRMELLTPTGGTRRSTSRGDGRLFTVEVAGAKAVDAAWRYEDSPIEELRDLVRLDWDAMDAWFEEEEEVHVHPRDPYARIDVLDSSRKVEVVLDGVTIAESGRPRILFETGLPPRYYLPKIDVRLELLERSETLTRCPYKGRADHFSARVNGKLHPDIAWSYPTTLPESQKIVGLVAFYDDRTQVYVDGERQG